jgi:hypothetical protein
MNETQKLSPGPAPEGETSVAENPAFVSACMSMISGHAAAYGWQLRNSKLTHSDVWGFVWRIDFLTKEQDPGSKSVARMVCWSAQEDAALVGTATYFAYPLEPL